MDVLSDVLGVVHSCGAVRCAATLTVPRGPGGVAFHLVVEGACQLDAAGTTLDLSAGDLVLLPQPAGGEPVGRAESTAISGGSSVPRRASMRVAEARTVPVVASGWLHGDHRMLPFVASLPPALVASSRPGRCAVEWVDPKGRGTAVLDEPVATWFATTLRFATEEVLSTRPGHAAVVGRLAELLVVQVLREYLNRMPPAEVLPPVPMDTQVNHAVHLLRSDPVRRWTVAELARTAAMSRTVFAERFVTLVGTTPMRYLAACRIRRAQQLLRQGAHSMQEVASQVGYDSDAAFNRAFKRITGLAPGTWRRQAGALVHHSRS